MNKPVRYTQVKPDNMFTQVIITQEEMSYELHLSYVCKAGWKFIISRDVW